MHENLSGREEIKVSSNRSFGIVFTLIFLAVGTLGILRGQSAGWLFLAGSALFFVVAFARPSILGPLNRAWIKFGFLLSRVGNPIILGIVFFLVIVPMAVVRKLLSEDSLHLDFESGRESYWEKCDPPRPKRGFMTKQF